MTAGLEASPSRDRAWWRRTIRVLRVPAPVFAALEDRSTEDEHARQEPLLAVILLAGIGGTLMTSFAGRLLDEESLDAVEVALWAFIGGAFDGFAMYWIVGALVFVGGAAAGSSWSYRQARHVLGFAVVPLALSLAVWPVRLALYGMDAFRATGADEGAGEAVFDAIGLGFLAWSAGLLVVGIRALHAWTWPRAVAAAALPLVVPLLAVLRANGVV